MDIHRIISFHTEMALFRNLCVKLRCCLCDALQYASAQPLVLTRGIHAPRPAGLPTADPIPLSCGIVLGLTKNCSFLNWKLTLVPIRFKGIYRWALISSYLRTTLLLALFYSVCGCFYQPTQFVPPRTPLPDKDFLVIRNLPTTWNALLRALEDDNDTRISSQNRRRRKIVIKPTTVKLRTYCDCGKLGQTPLSGKAHRTTVITLKRTAPQETVVKISSSYSTIHKWRNADGRVVKEETIACVSNGLFERKLHKRILSYLSQ